MKKRVVVGMSGGVDSAVAAHLLKKDGYDVIGVFMKNWEDNESEQCNAYNDYEDVRTVCEKLDIPYYQVNFEKEYWDEVFTYFLKEYNLGRTPNPDVLCNSKIKFKSFLNLAINVGSDLIATGHYVRTDLINDEVVLKKGLDSEKDQSYFLCMLTQKQLKNALFPLGSKLKSEIRSIAANIGLSIANKKDSTGICFIGEKKFKKFLQNYLPAKPGEIRSLDNNIIGTHDGLMYYTLGQRRGLAIGGKKGYGDDRWFVIKKDMENNILYVSQGNDSSELYSNSLIMINTNMISNKTLKTDFFCSAKVRYRQPDQLAHALYLGENKYRINFDKKQRAVTPGQFCVLYDNDICLGGGIIDKIIN